MKVRGRSGACRLCRRSGIGHVHPVRLTRSPCNIAVQRTGETMRNAITKIEAQVPFAELSITINLDAKNLIITGRNGSGKTSFLDAIFKKLKLWVVDHKAGEVLTWEAHARSFKNKMDSNKEGSAEYIEALNHYKVCRGHIDPYVQQPHIRLTDDQLFRNNYANGSAIVDLFVANRQSRITPAKSAQSLDYRETRPTEPEKIGADLEQHLVNLAARRAFAKVDGKDDGLVERIDAWFMKFDKNLKFLFEDDSVRMQFNADTFKFHVLQNGKQPFALQNLSSGFSAIFSILSSLIMRAQYIGGEPSSLYGTVFIDEIDAHLHVSLQKKILPFLADSFPNLQFIVTTHSPFVLTSVDNAEIFDMDKRERVENLSNYSYEAVLEGLFEVGPSSFLLKRKINELSGLVDTGGSFDNEAVKQLVDEILPNKNHLDEESGYFLQKAIFELNKHKGK